VCEVGEVVHVPLKDMDKAKVDTGNLTGVIVQVDKGRSQARVAVKSGLLKSWYVYHRLGHVTGVGNNVELNELTNAFANWKTMPVITEREAARNESMVGGQGKGDVTCNCRGPSSEVVIWFIWDISSCVSTIYSHILGHKVFYVPSN
jgi:hypothetical protein